MKEKSYQSIIDHYEACLDLHGDTHLGVDWPNLKDAEKRYSVMLDVVREYSSGLTLLDFGCGTSHLYPYLMNSRFAGLKYTGLDISQAFCNTSRKKYPNVDYICLDILTESANLGEYDYVVMNGVFTEKCDLSYQDMFKYFKRVMREIFPKVRQGLAFNVMSKSVEWERDDLFHLPLDSLVKFLVLELSRHFVIRNDYGLYEYTVYVYKRSSS